MFRQTNSFVLIGSFVFSLFFMHIAGFSQTKIDRIPGVYNVKFKQGKLRNLTRRIALEDIDVTQVRNVLSQKGFRGAEKLFKRFSPGDTIAISRDFKQVRLIDLSHWYTIAVSDTSDAEGFIKALSQIPGIIGVSQARIFRRHDIFPDDPRFSNQNNNQQWGALQLGYTR